MHANVLKCYLDKNKPDHANFFRQTREITAEVCGVSLATVKHVCVEGKKSANFEDEP